MRLRVVERHHRSGRESACRESGRGLPQSKTLRARPHPGARPTLVVVECGSPLSLFQRKSPRHLGDAPGEGGRSLQKRRWARYIRGVSPQQTLRTSVSLAGVGLHGGNKVQMTFLPAPPNTGIRFRRIDLEGRPEIEGRVDHVGDTTRSTTLVRGNARVHTVEHIMAAFSGCGIDNAVVELDASEPPIGDGSSLPYVQMIQQAGLLPQAEGRQPYQLTEPIELVAGDSTLVALPHDRLKITCTNADRTGRYTQVFSVEVTPESWVSELAPARTFCFFEEIEALVKNGLIKGGSLENAVVIRDDAVLTTEPLRFADEFVRHKILDVVGDLALIGRPLQAHVVAVRPSHGTNCELARQIVEQMRRPEAVMNAFVPPAPPKTTSARSTPASEGGSNAVAAVAEVANMGIDYVMRLLPHRYPFLMVDRVTKVEGNHIVALKNVTINEPYFVGHFPGHPIMPGVLQLEAIAQVAGILMLRQAENVGKLAYFMSAESVKWRRPVRPGDQLIIDVELTKSRGKIGRAKGVCSVGGETVSEAEVTFMLTDG
ncbi:MAG: bifunctional UDP-3-O-[3-hydroxymyristoyl] N-acetylglucosamine deacetylase/3-hydroxyacyl-ACP dehydratase [Verrucomicrobiales bacterium]|nr:bifunctional UDP-3-O-[3-hydroxymyristoyl] N-acetylglucosamine deacetylase/3-hydroxyacyl-ACP dehydratase [Verrucomicrobiales bacterium]